MNISPDKTGQIKEYGIIFNCYSWASGRKSISINGYEIDLTEQQYQKIKHLFPKVTE